MIKSCGALKLYWSVFHFISRSTLSGVFIVVVLFTPLKCPVETLLKPMYINTAFLWQMLETSFTWFIVYWYSNVFCYSPFVIYSILNQQKVVTLVICSIYLFLCDSVWTFTSLLWPSSQIYTRKQENTLNIL